jgi:hypothetical protein
VAFLKVCIPRLASPPLAHGVKRGTHHALAGEYSLCCYPDLHFAHQLVIPPARFNSHIWSRASAIRSASRGRRPPVSPLSCWPSGVQCGLKHCSRIFHKPCSLCMQAPCLLLFDSSGTSAIPATMAPG